METKLGYWPALDGLRGLSIIAVMAFNGHLFGMHGGFVGVDVFFVLSGFLITSLLFQEYESTGTIGLRNFYMRRALRLLPALIALSLFCAVFALLIQSPEKALTTFKGIGYALLYVANWAQVSSKSAGIGALSHTWSLSVEEQFYIVWPLVLFILLKLRSKRLILTTMMLMIATSLFMSVWLWRTNPNFLRIYHGSDTRAQELLIGCVAALLYGWGILHSSSGMKTALRLLSIGALVTLFVSFFTFRHYSAFVYNGGFSLISVATAAIILDFGLFRSTLSRVFEFPPLVWLGKISYGLYLWHFPIFEMSRQFPSSRMSPITYELTKVGAVLLVATASYYFLELPFLKLKRRYVTAQNKPAELLPSLPRVNASESLARV